MKAQNKPCRCGEQKPEAFGHYLYTTNQGKRKTRRDSRCMQCRRNARTERYYRNPTKQNAEVKAWRIVNREHLAQYAKRYRATEKGRLAKARAQAARDARKRSSTAGHEQSTILGIYRDAQLLESKLRSCVECDDDLELQIHVDHVIPISRGGAHAIGNLQLLSARENLKKGARV